MPSIGNLQAYGGLDAAFMGAAQSSAFNSTSVVALFSPVTASLCNKRLANCAAIAVSNSSFQNSVGRNWQDSQETSLTSTAAVVTYIVNQFAAYAPNDQAFLRSGATGYRFQGSSDGSTWTTLASGTTAGTVGETLNVTVSSVTAYQYHQFVLQGDGTTAAVAGLSISFSNAAANDI